MPQFTDRKRCIVPTLERADAGSIWIEHFETDGRQYVVRFALVQCAHSPVEQTYSALDRAFLAPMLKRFRPDAFFEDYSFGETLVDGDAVLPDQSKVTAACALSMTVQTPAIQTTTCLHACGQMGKHWL